MEALKSNEYESMFIMYDVNKMNHKIVYTV